MVNVNFTGQGHFGLNVEKIQIHKNFSEFWYKKKCSREANISWEFKDQPRQLKLPNFDPNLL